MDSERNRREASSISIGQIVGHYRVMSQLGAGGMGEVWEAEDSKLDRRVALKVLPAELASSSERLERFEREAKALAALDHPNIVTIHSVEEADGLHFLTMALVRGDTLSGVIPQAGLTLEQFLKIAVPLAGAVAAAHEKGITHRDLKPANVMVTDEGFVKVLDFGLAKVEARDVLATELPTERLTAEGTVMGTTAYMSPEQVEGKPIDHRSDIFSLGVLLHEMATGKLPFEGDTAAGVMSSILKDRPPALAEVRTDLPRQLSRIVGQCLEKDPHDRFQTARDVFNGLRNLRKEVESDPSWTSSGSVPVIEGPSKATRRWLTATGMLAVILVLIWFGYSSDEEAGEEATPTLAETAAPEQKDEPPMIAVLPFENLGPPEDSYFAAGMTEEISARLASLREVGVIASTSARQYEGTAKSAPQIGEELGADYLIMGSVRWARAADGSSRLRITPRLISTADDEQVWADSYDRVFEDVFGIQSDIANKVVELLDVTLLDSEQALLEDRPTENMEAYQYYLLSMAVEGHFAAEDPIRQRKALAERAVELDPDFADAWLRIAVSEQMLYGYGHDKSEEQRQRARSATQKVIEISSDLPARVHAANGSYYFHVERNYSRAFEERSHLARLEPNNSFAYAGMAFALRRMGRFEEALPPLLKAQRLDPRSYNTAVQIGSLLAFLGRFEEAMPNLDRAIEIRPRAIRAYFQKATTFWRWSADVTAARAVLDRLPEDVALDPGFALDLYSQLIYEDKPTEALEYLASVPEDAIGMSTFYRPKTLMAGLSYELLGDSSSARRSFEAAAAHLGRELEMRPDHEKLVSALGVTYAMLGREDKAIRLGIKATEVVPMSRDPYFGQAEVTDLAWIYTRVGEYDLALDQLEILLSMPSWITIPYLKLDPRWAPLWDLPRFQEMEEKYD